MEFYVREIFSTIPWYYSEHILFPANFCCNFYKGAYDSDEYSDNTSEYLAYDNEDVIEAWDIECELLMETSQELLNFESVVD